MVLGQACSGLYRQVVLLYKWSDSQVHSTYYPGVCTLGRYVCTKVLSQYVPSLSLSAPVGALSDTVSAW